MVKFNFRMLYIFSGLMCVRESWIFFLNIVVELVN